MISLSSANLNAINRKLAESIDQYCSRCIDKNSDLTNQESREDAYQKMTSLCLQSNIVEISYIKYLFSINQPVLQQYDVITEIVNNQQLADNAKIYHVRKALELL